MKIRVLLVILTAVTYIQVLNSDFINMDDDLFIVNNPHIQHGLTPASIRWAFEAELTYETAHGDYWTPLTVLSRIGDIQLFGLKPAGHHLTNLLLHICNALLLFSVLVSMTGSPLRSACVAAIFAVHPLHVESVAWVTERKDILSLFFGLLAIRGYVRVVKIPLWREYAAFYAAAAFSMMSKPMMVVLPALLVLISFWPLRLITFSRKDIGSWIVVAFRTAPVWAFSAVIALITLRSAGRPFRPVLPLLHAGNVINSYIAYLARSVWPFSLSCHYPFPKSFPFPQIAIEGILLIIATILAAALHKRRPYFTTGWLWYLIALTPVIGMTTFAANANRYTYLPHIGTYLWIVWATSDALSSISRRTKQILAAAVVAALSAVSWREVGYWKDSRTLFERSLAVEPENNARAHRNLAAALADEGMFDEAIRHYQISIDIAPYAAFDLNALGNLFAVSGRAEKAIEQYQTAIRLDPNFAPTWCNLGNIYLETSKIDSAVYYLEEARRLAPDDPRVNNNLGSVYFRMAKYQEALNCYEAAINSHPRKANVLNNIGNVFFQTGRPREAIRNYEAALALDPNLISARANLIIARHVLAQAPANP